MSDAQSYIAISSIVAGALFAASAGTPSSSTDITTPLGSVTVTGNFFQICTSSDNGQSSCQSATKDCDGTSICPAYCSFLEAGGAFVILATLAAFAIAIPCVLRGFADKKNITPKIFYALHAVAALFGVIALALTISNYSGTFCGLPATGPDAKLGVGAILSIIAFVLVLINAGMEYFVISGQRSNGEYTAVTN